MTAQPGCEAVVQVPVATLWATPEAVRPTDGPALTDCPDVAAWIAGMDRDQRVGDCVLTQLLLGERVLVTETRPDDWVRVVALGQPAGRLDGRGYPGWLRGAHLATPTGPAAADRGATAGAAGPPTETLTVDVVRTTLRAAPDGPAALAGVVLGTRLTAAGPPEGDWRPVHVPGRTGPLWARRGDVAPLPAQRPAATETLAVAERLRDLVYIWGGLSTDGIDCSGLVHLAWRRYGVTLPRDADDQARATTSVTLDAERPGDLYFFARPGRHIHHVGIVSAEPREGRRRMLHACYLTRRVVEEELPPDRVATLVGARRV
ncbi:NlpC/P60 family protein [Micromonospora sp. DT31]|uniref:C40 family peptidase n=1 Tax=Micromonospora sp. DT31 TaxID=3393434 RepID=UPI003CE7667E